MTTQYATNGRLTFFSSRRRHTRYWRDWSSDVCSSDLTDRNAGVTQTGYYMRKFLNPKQVIDNDPTYGSSQNYIIWRYAELLLDYAEIDFHQGRTKAALDKVNEIRTRAHMHKLEDRKSVV